MATRKTRAEKQAASLATNLARTSTTIKSFAMQPPSRSYKVSSAALRQIGEEPINRRRRRRMLSAGDREWQSECLDYAEKVAELGALLELQANTLSLCDFPVRRWDADAASWVANDPEFVEPERKPPPKKELPPQPGLDQIPGAVERADAVEENERVAVENAQQPISAAQSLYDARPGNVMRSFLGPDGGFEELIRRAAYLLFSTGETTLLGSQIDEGILWEFLSVEELRVDPEGNYQRHHSAISGPENIPNTDYTARLHQSSYRYSAQATSQVKRVLPICQEIVTLTMMVDAVAKSRVSANLLFIPDELSFAPDPEPKEGDEAVEDGGDPDTPPADADENAVDEDTLIEDLFEHMTAPLTDPGSAARIVPIIIRGKAEFGKEIRVISLARELDMWAQELRMEALGRLAQGLDAPPEAMQGKGTANHWTAANIDQEFIVKHIQPQGRRIAAFLTVSYLRPMLVAFEGMTQDEAENYMVEFDPSPVIARADEAKSARDLAEWLSDEAILAANGFTKADLAGAETIRQRRLWELVKTQPATFGKLIKLLPGMQDITDEMLGTPGPPAAAPLPMAPPIDDGDDESKVSRGAEGDTSKGDKVVDKTSGEETPDKPTGLRLLIERVVTAADAAWLRARERATNQVLSTVQKDPVIKLRLQNVSKPRVLSSLTVEEQQKFTNRAKAKMLADAWDDFTASTTEWVAQFLVEHGDEIRTAEMAAATTAAVLRDRLNSYTNETLFLPANRMANGLHVPTELVAEAIEQAVLAEAV